MKPGEDKSTSNPAEQVTLVTPVTPGGDNSAARTRQLGGPSAAEGRAPGRFGEYEILGEIARGGMGVVYKARHVALGRVVALKMILSGRFAGTEEIERFFAEARSAARLSHAGIVPVYDVGSSEGQHYFSMGLIEGESLAARLRTGPLGPREAARIVLAVTRAMQYAHEQGLIHRDLKPANILLDVSGEPKVTDFGLAKNLLAAGDGLTASGDILGTPGFMPPEQAAGRLREVNVRSDVYSLGAVLYHTITGRPPFQAAQLAETLAQVIDQPPVPPRVLNREVPQDLETICLKCLQKDQADRYASAKDLGEELQRYLDGEPILARADSSMAWLWRAVRGESRHAVVLARWCRIWMWHAGIVCSQFLLTDLLLRLRVTSVVPFLVLWSMGLSGMLAAVWHFRFRTGFALASIEKQVGQIWGACAVAVVLTTLSQMTGQPDVRRLLPLFMLEAGLAFSAMATLMGNYFHITAAACAVSAVVMTFAPDVGPVFFAIMLSLGLFWPAWRYSQVAETDSH